VISERNAWEKMDSIENSDQPEIQSNIVIDKDILDGVKGKRAKRKSRGRSCSLKPSLLEIVAVTSLTICTSCIMTQVLFRLSHEKQNPGELVTPSDLARMVAISGVFMLGYAVYVISTVRLIVRLITKRWIGIICFTGSIVILTQGSGVVQSSGPPELSQAINVYISVTIGGLLTISTLPLTRVHPRDVPLKWLWQGVLVLAVATFTGGIVLSFHQLNLLSFITMVISAVSGLVAYIGGWIAARSFTDRIDEWEDSEIEKLINQA
jgi:hypothetical protein